MGVTEDVFEAKLSQLKTIPTKYSPEDDLLVDWTKNPFYPDGKHWDDDKLWSYTIKEIDELIELCKENWLNEHYNEIRYSYREMLKDTWRYWIELHMDEVNDGWDARVSESFHSWLYDNYQHNMQLMKDHLYPLID